MAETAELQLPRRRPGWWVPFKDPVVAVPAFLFVCVIVGAICGIVWALMAQRPGYTVGQNLKASMGERALAGVFASDALYCLIVAVLGVAAGVAAWLLFRRLGWWVCPLALFGALAAALAVWQFGLLVGQEGFDDRLAAARPGDVVPIDLELRSLAALLLAPFFAITPVMVFAALWPDEPEISAADELAGIISPGD